MNKTSRDLEKDLNLTLKEEINLKTRSAKLKHLKRKSLISLKALDSISSRETLKMKKKGKTRKHLKK